MTLRFAVDDRHVAPLKAQLQCGALKPPRDRARSRIHAIETIGEAAARSAAVTVLGVTKERSDRHNLYEVSCDSFSRFTSIGCVVRPLLLPTMLMMEA